MSSRDPRADGPSCGATHQTVLLGRFKAAHYSVKTTIVTSNGKAIASKYRIAEIAVR